MQTATEFDPMGHVTCAADLDALWQLAAMTRSETALEVGTWAGLSALSLAHEFDRVYCVDTWEPKGDSLELVARNYPPDVAFRTFCRNMGNLLFDRVLPCRGSSLEWAALWPFPVDLIFLDADHRYPAIAADIDAWQRHVKPGGILCGHDHQPNFPGVVQAVREAFGGKARVLGDAMWYVRL